VSEKPTVSVIIPTYNGAAFAVEAVDSVLAQTRPPDEIIVIDDGSTDDTQSRLARYADRIRYIRQSNGGVANARNHGIQESRGSLIAFLDGDDRWLPEKLERQLECLAAHPEADLIHTNFLHWNDHTGELTPVKPGLERYTGSCFQEFFWRCGVKTSTVLLTRRCLERVGLFDEHIPGGGSVEDFDLFLRVARHFQLAFVPEPLALYRHHGSNATLDTRRILESLFWVTERSFAMDRAFVTALGPQRVRRHMRSLAFTAGYGHAEKGDLRNARRMFRCALRYAPVSPYIWALWVSTLIPHDMRRWLRSLKQRFAPRRVSPA